MVGKIYYPFCRIKERGRSKGLKKYLKKMIFFFKSVKDCPVLGGGVSKVGQSPTFSCFVSLTAPPSVVFTVTQSVLCK